PEAGVERVGPEAVADAAELMDAALGGADDDAVVEDRPGVGLAGEREREHDAAGDGAEVGAHADGDAGVPAALLDHFARFGLAAGDEDRALGADLRAMRQVERVE